MKQGCYYDSRIVTCGRKGYAVVVEEIHRVYLLTKMIWHYEAIISRC